MHYQRAVVWQKAMEIAEQVYSLVPLLPRVEVYGMRSQITRAAISVAANVAEGWTRETARDKANFLAIAHGSLSEVETLLTLCERVGWFPQAETIRLRGGIDEVSRMLTALRRKRRSEATANHKQ